MCTDILLAQLARLEERLAGMLEEQPSPPTPPTPPANDVVTYSRSSSSSRALLDAVNAAAACPAGGGATADTTASLVYIAPPISGLADDDR
jgi:hypothetical protein